MEEADFAGMVAFPCEGEGRGRGGFRGGGWGGRGRLKGRVRESGYGYSGGRVCGVEGRAGRKWERKSVMGDGKGRWMVVGWWTALGGGDDGTRRLRLSV